LLSGLLLGCYSSEFLGFFFSSLFFGFLYGPCSCSGGFSLSCGLSFLGGSFLCNTSPVLFDILDTLLGEILFVLIAEALLIFTWENVSILEKLWTTSLVFGLVSILDTPVVLNTSIEVSKLSCAGFVLLSEVNETVTEAVSSVFGTSGWNLLRLWLTPALLFHIWVWIFLYSECGKIAVVPVSSFLGEIFPCSEIIEVF
jgi:hypothetical protein